MSEQVSVQPRQQATPGVYYHREDYLGVWRRLLIELIDVFIALFAWLLILAAIALFVADERRATGFGLLSLPMVLFAYFVPLKGSRLQTPGYRLAGARLVDLHGQAPTLVTVCLRFFFSLLAPLTFVVDLMWIGGDAHRQALRDKFAHTYVVRRAAKPAGMAPVVYSDYSIMGTRFIFPEVRAGEEVNAP